MKLDDNIAFFRGLIRELVALNAGEYKATRSALICTRHFTPSTTRSRRCRPLGVQLVAPRAPRPRVRPKVIGGMWAVGAEIDGKHSPPRKKGRARACAGRDGAPKHFETATVNACSAQRVTRLVAMHAKAKSMTERRAPRVSVRPTSSDASDPVQRDNAGPQVRELRREPLAGQDKSVGQFPRNGGTTFGASSARKLRLRARDARFERREDAP